MFPSFRKRDRFLKVGDWNSDKRRDAIKIDAILTSFNLNIS